MAFIVLFWIWTAFSVGILVRRSLLKKRAKATRRRAELDAELAAALQRNAPPSPAFGAAAAATSPHSAPTWPAPPAAASPPHHAPPQPYIAPATPLIENRHEIVDAEIVIDPAADQAQTAAPSPDHDADAGLLALPPVRPAETLYADEPVQPAATPIATPTGDPFVVEGEVQPPVASRDGAFAERGEHSGIQTLADVMAGFKMPCGLMPLIAGDSSRMDEKAAFVTDEATPEVVGRSIADELERLGMQVSSVSDDVALAQGPNGSLQIQIFITGPAVNGRTHDRFPTAPPHSVIVQFALG